MADSTRAGHRWGWVNVVLGALVVVVGGYALLILAQGPAVLPGTTRAERAAHDYQAVRAAAAREVRAYLTLDYRKPRKQFSTVLAGATGQFARHYRSGRKHLESATRSNRVVSVGTVRYVGVRRLHEGEATLYVAADSVVRNKSTGHAEASSTCQHSGAVCRFYRIRLKMAETAEGWKVARLDEVS